MSKYVVPVLSLLAIPAIALLLAVILLAIFGPPPEYTPQLTQYFKSLNYVIGVWVGYMIWGRS